MSEEEIIKNIEDMLLHAETNLLDYEALAIQGLLDLYNKEKEKNKKIEDKIKEKITYLQSLEFEDKLVSQWVANATTIRILQGLEE